MKGNGQNNIEEFMLGLRVDYLLGRTWKRNTPLKANSSVGVILVEERRPRPKENKKSGVRRESSKHEHGRRVWRFFSTVVLADMVV